MISGEQLYTILACTIAIPAPAAAVRRNPSTKGDIVSFPPIRVGRANLMEQKYIPQWSGGEMSAKRLAVLVVPAFVLVSSALAHIHKASITAGRTFVSTQTIVNSSAP